MLRLRALSGFRISLDPTWDYTDVAIWTGAELAAGIVCASLPAVRQLLTLILPKRWSSLLTNRSRSRNAPMPDQGHPPDAHRQRKVHSLFPLPSISYNSKRSYGVTTDISSSAWINSQAESLKDLERGRIPIEEKNSDSWLPLRALFQSGSRSMRTSFWSSVDRQDSFSTQKQSNHPPHVTGFPAMSSRNGVAEVAGKSSMDGEVELLRLSESSHWTNDGDEITALPRAYMYQHPH
ncbi:uncharacterized protein EKO05_0008910 [Ascochyta rabiei]|nr:uncharacterized protein EKO05_0008910 [Ascochyta rabiei]UPX18616.1 hypothetical protein EKO05_0008910 [Ascochyta rabiei]